MPNWESLKKLTGSKLAQHVILVPIVGWLLVYQNTFAEMISRLVGIEVGSTLSWEVLVFYVGLVLLGVSASAFRILGPEPVLNHEGLQGFTEDTTPIMTRSELKRFCTNNRLDEPNEVVVLEVGIGQVQDATLEQWRRLNKEGILDSLSEHYRNKNICKPVVRALITVVFLFGSALVLLPTAVTLKWVIWQLI